MFDMGDPTVDPTASAFDALDADAQALVLEER